MREKNNLLLSNSNRILICAVNVDKQSVFACASMSVISFWLTLSSSPVLFHSLQEQNIAHVLFTVWSSIVKRQINKQSLIVSKGAILIINFSSSEVNRITFATHNLRIYMRECFQIFTNILSNSITVRLFPYCFFLFFIIRRVNQLKVNIVRQQ